MNTLLDLVNRWAEKFTYRVLKIIGTSKPALDKYLAAIKEKREDIIEADKEISGKVPFIKWVFWFALVLTGAYLYNTFFVKRKRY